ncbi:YeeE/YedE family protein [soil metagenome]
MEWSTLFPLGWQHYLAGGLLLGIAVALMFMLTGLVTGMSSVFTSTWSYFSRARFFQQSRFTGSRVWRLVLALGLVLGAGLWWVLLGPSGGIQTGVPAWQLAAGGFLVGYGARMSNGCTSGHGICGLASLQWPSALAVMIFLTTAMATANLVLAFGGR